MLKSYFLTGEISSHETINTTQTSILFPRRILKAIKEGSDRKLIRSAKAVERRKFKRRVDKISVEKVPTTVRLKGKWFVVDNCYHFQNKRHFHHEICY